MNKDQLDNSTEPRSVDQQQACYAVGDELINRHTKRVATVLRVDANGDHVLSRPLDHRVRYDASLIAEHWSLHNAPGAAAEGRPS